MAGVDEGEEVDQLVVENEVDEMVGKLVELDADELGVVSIVVLVEEEDVVLPRIEKKILLVDPD